MLVRVTERLFVRMDRNVGSRSLNPRTWNPNTSFSTVPHPNVSTGTVRLYLHNEIAFVLILTGDMQQCLPQFIDSIRCYNCSLVPKSIIPLSLFQLYAEILRRTI